MVGSKQAAAPFHISACGRRGLRLQMADETRSEFTARFDTDGFPQDYPKGFRLHQRTRSSKASIAGSNHEAFRIVLLWLRQKYVVFTRGVTRMPSHVRRMLEPRHGPKLLPCPASGWRSKARQSESSESQCFFIAILLVINIMLSFYIHYYSYMYVHELITIHMFVYRCHWLKGSFDYEA